MKSRIRPELRLAESLMGNSEEAKHQTSNHIIPSETYAELNLVLKLMEEKENFRPEIDNPTELDIELCRLLASKVTDHKPTSVGLLARIILMVFGSKIGRALSDSLKVEMVMEIIEVYPTRVDMHLWFNRLLSTKTPSADFISLAELETKLDEKIDRINADFDGDEELSEEDKARLVRTEAIARKLGLCVPEDMSDVYSSPSKNSYLDKDDNDE